MKIIKSCNDNVFIALKEQEDIKEGVIIMQESDSFKTTIGTVLFADLSDMRVADTKIEIGSNVLVHKTSVISEKIGLDVISYVKAASILAIIE